MTYIGKVMHRVKRGLCNHVFLLNILARNMWIPPFLEHMQSSWHHFH